MRERGKKVLVTGGAGFIGSNFIRYLCSKHPSWQIVNLDKLTYAGNLENLADIAGKPNYRFIKGDIADPKIVSDILSEGFDIIINFAAESHVDRSVLDSSPFVETNIKGTQILLEGARRYKVGKFIQISTDEVYGSIIDGKFNEESPLMPSSPYASSKAAADLLCLSYFKTYKLPVLITRSSNNFGPFQFPEKLIPLAITNAIEDKPIPIYGDGQNIRDWLYVLDHCEAIDLIIRVGKAGEIYNIASGEERTNLELLDEILKIMGKPENLIQFVKDRPAHDRRYALDVAKIRGLGWKPKYHFKESLKETINWYLSHQSWWRRIKSGDYADYYEKVYSKR